MIPGNPNRYDTVICFFFTCRDNIYRHIDFAVTETQFHLTYFCYPFFPDVNTFCFLQIVALLIVLLHFYGIFCMSKTCTTFTSTNCSKSDCEHCEKILTTTYLC